MSTGDTRTCKILVVAVVWVLIGRQAGHAQPVLYVDDDAATNGNGESWASAYQDLQDALIHASTNETVAEIHVAGGVYRPDRGTGDPHLAFELVDGVAVYGGYAGVGMPDPDHRDVVSNASILTGDLSGNDGPDFTNNDENSFHVVTSFGVSEAAVLDGFTITGGNANASCCMYDRGGGMYNEEGNPTIHHCTFQNNMGTEGGAIYNNASDPTIAGCTFFDNFGIASGGGVSNYNSQPSLEGCSFEGNRTLSNGGGLRNFNSSPAILDCTFVANSADDGGAVMNELNSHPVITNGIFMQNTAGGGAAMYNELSSNPVMTDCTFTANEAAGGGAMMNANSSNAILRRCTFDANTVSGTAGAMYNIESSPTLTDCRFVGNTSDGSAGAILNSAWSDVTLVRCSFVQNSALSVGGALFPSYNSTCTAINCSFFGNEGSSGGGIYSREESVVTLVNCIFSRNRATTDDGGGIHGFSDTILLANCTFCDNEAFDDGGGIYKSRGGLALANCILWGNTGNNGTQWGQSDQVYCSSVTPLINYTCIQGWTGGWGGTGNIGNSPLFVDRLGPDFQGGTEDDNLRLLPSSPCIDTGTSGVLIADAHDLDSDGDTAEPIPIDLDNHARLLCGGMDMGAYESGIGDDDCDGDVDSGDFARWADCATGPNLGPPQAGCKPFQFDADQDVDLLDFAGFQLAFTN